MSAPDYALFFDTSIRVIAVRSSPQKKHESDGEHRPWVGQNCHLLWRIATPPEAANGP